MFAINPDSITRIGITMHSCDNLKILIKCSIAWAFHCWKEDNREIHKFQWKTIHVNGILISIAPELTNRMQNCVFLLLFITFWRHMAENQHQHHQKSNACFAHIWRVIPNWIHWIYWEDTGGEKLAEHMGPFYQSVLSGLMAWMCIHILVLNAITHSCPHVWFWKLMRNYNIITIIIIIIIITITIIVIIIVISLLGYLFIQWLWTISVTHSHRIQW